jgi:hypothetical protein
MLLWLTELLAKEVRAFNVFGYLTLRAVLACMTALFISFIVGPKVIAWLTRMKIGQSVRDDGPQTHLTKAGTPTMGGALILVSISVTTLLWGDLGNRFILGHTARDDGIRRDRLGRRLPQGRAPQSEGPFRAAQVPVAIGDRRRGGPSISLSPYRRRTTRGSSRCSSRGSAAGSIFRCPRRRT